MTVAGQTGVLGDLHEIQRDMVLPSPEIDNSVKRNVRIAYLVSHPIQYQAPLLRRIAREPDIDLTVFFGSDFSLRDYQDEGFGVDVKWDVPLLDGYRYKFLPVLRDDGTQTVTTPLNRGIFSALRGGGGEFPFERAAATIEYWKF